MTFTELNLCPPLLRAVQAEKYHTPTPIQAQAIPQVLSGRDLIGCAQTGTGKTAAFALPILQRLHVEEQTAVPHAPRVLVLSPTRELATQIGESFQSYGRHLAFRHAVIYGGVGQGRQVQALARGVHVLAATPGRLLDLMGQGHVRLDRVSMLVVDEADRLLDMGFLPDLRRIVAAVPKRRQSLCFSATMPADVAGLAKSLLTDPVRIEVTPPSSTVERIEQRVLFLAAGEKPATLNRLLRGEDFAQVLVFTRTKRRAETVARQIRAARIEADAIHGDKTQNARERALLRFRMGRTRVLVATDVAARGLDVEGISHVINYDVPGDPESYIHRIGRTGRAGASGIALSFCDPNERGALRAIERLLRRSIPAEGEPPEISAPASASEGRRQRSRRPGPASRGRKPRRRVRAG
ncbi:MAG: DEAD/DEAH box helicase [Planctomycetaceae bacterium]